MSENDNQGAESIRRRKVLKTAGVSGLAALAGCSGNQGQQKAPKKTPKPSKGTTAGNTPTEGRWPDYSGKEMLFLTDEASPALKKLYRTLKADFKAATGGDLKFNFGELGAGVARRLSQLIQAGNPPEIYTTAPDEAWVFIQNDQLEPMTGTMETIMNKWGKPPNPTSQRMLYENKDYLVPWDTHAALTHYRSEIWGRDSDNLVKTWDDFVGEVESHHGEQNLDGTFVGAGVHVCPQLVHKAWFYSNGAKIGDRKGGDPQIVIGKGENRNRAIETIDFLKRLQQYSVKAPDAGCGPYTNALMGQVSQSTSYPGGRVKTNVVNAGMKFADDVRTINHPRNRKMDGEQVTHGDSEGFVMFKNASNKEMAKTLIEFFYTSEKAVEYQKMFYNAAFGHLYPPYPKLAQGPWQELVDKNVGNGWAESDIQAVKDNVNELEIRNLSVPLRQYMGPVNQSYILAEEVKNALVNGKSSEAAIDDMQKRLSTELDKAKKQFS